MKLEAGTKVRIISNTRPHHHFAIDSIATVISSGPLYADLMGEDERGNELRQILCFHDIEPLKQKGVIK